MHNGGALPNGAPDKAHAAGGHGKVASKKAAAADAPTSNGCTLAPVDAVE